MFLKSTQVVRRMPSPYQVLEMLCKRMWDVVRKGLLIRRCRWYEVGWGDETLHKDNQEQLSLVATPFTLRGKGLSS